MACQPRAHPPFAAPVPSHPPPLPTPSALAPPLVGPTPAPAEAAPAAEAKPAAAEAKAPAAVVESVKAAGDIYSPVTGTVVAINEALENSPALVNTDPHGEGWIFLVTLDAPEEVAQLKSAAEYRAFIGE